MEAENRESTGRGVQLSGTDVKGNVAIGNDNMQTQYLSGGLGTDSVYEITREIRRLLREHNDVENKVCAQSALDELDAALTTVDAPSRPRRLHAALAKLWNAVGDAAASALPLAQLADAINNLVQPRH
jgi:hypothetical protein